MTNKTREHYNDKILALLTKEVAMYPDLRFQQLLYNVGITNTDKDYNEEPVQTYRKVYGRINNIKEPRQ